MNRTYEVWYECGESRYGGSAVNYMLVEGVGIDGEPFELYAEYNLTDEPEDEYGNLIDEDAGYSELVSEIVEQAQKIGITTDQLNFYY